MVRVTSFGLVLVSVVLAGSSVLAQPVIIPLQHERAQPGQEGEPVVSAPPIAPPQAGPSLPSTTDVAGGPKVNPQEETASEPAPK